MEIAACTHAPKLDPRVRRTRKLLEDALRGLMNERPYSQISVLDIAERATVNRATFYAHYEDKDHLANTMIRGDLEAALLVPMTPGMPLNAENLNSVATALFEFVGGLHQSCPKAEKPGEEPVEKIGATLQAGIQEVVQLWLDHDPEAMRRFPGAAKENVATMISWSLYGAATRWSRLFRRVPAPQAAHEIVALLLPT
ncbi:MAG: TetR/AcrR family transcriptional regulator [Fimbriimonas sp.]